jgi:hypothetical protein
LGARQQPSSDASEEVPMVTQLDEERRRLWELAKANLEKAHKRYKDFADKSRREVKFQVGNEVWLNIKNFRLPEGLSHKFMGPYAGPFKVLEKKLSDTYKLELPENLRVHPTFHVSFLKLVKLNILLLQVFNFPNNLFCLFQLIGQVLILLLDLIHLPFDCDKFFVIVFQSRMHYF